MSSLTTVSGSMEESLPRQREDQLVDTRLSLVIGGGAGRGRPPSVQELDHAAAGGGKRKREVMISGTTGQQQVSKRAAGSEDDGGGARKSKKLRLTGEQAALLERSFHAHNILSHGEKQELARRLRLRPRQVEVWFQNRRARTKLKQTEVDRELLRRWCQRLSEENARLRQEIADARRPAPCPSCKLAGDVRPVAAGS